MSNNDEAPGWSVGALLGLIAGGPAGAFIGALLGAAADEACQPSGAQPGVHHRDSSRSRTRSQSYQHSQNANAGYQRPRREAWVDNVSTLPSAVDNAFQALGLRPGATLEAVKRRYHQLARRYHPDLFEGPGTNPQLRAAAQEQFVRIREAYEVLNEYIANRA